MITKEMMQRASEYVSEDSVKYLLEKYPRAIGVEEIMGNGDFLPNDFLMWMLYGVSLTEEIRNQIEQRLSIKDSKAYFHVHHITNCARIKNSAYCKDSEKVGWSTDVEGSEWIESSQDVVHSQHVECSEVIRSSSHVKNSREVLNSHFVIDSEHVTSSASVRLSSGVKNSHYILSSKNVDRALLSRDLSNSSNKILCEGISDNSTPMILNEKVSARIFSRVYDELVSLVRRYEIEEREGSDLLFIGLPNSPTFWMQVKSIIPSYKPELAYQITYNPFSL